MIYCLTNGVQFSFQGILFTDHRTPEQVRETVRLVRSETPEMGGRFGYPNKRFIGSSPALRRWTMPGAWTRSFCSS